MLTRDGVTLRCLEPEDLARMHAWSLDLEVANAASWSQPLSRAGFAKHWEPLILEPRDDYRVFGIESEERLVGRIELGHVDLEHRHAFVGLVIGERAFRGRGVGKRAVLLLADYAFSVENLEKLSAEVFAFNERSCRLFASVGFEREGLRRQQEMHLGRRQDMVVFGLLRGEFLERHETAFRV